MQFRNFAPSILLPSSVDANKSIAELKDVVLKLTLPKAEEFKPRIRTVKAK